MPCSVSGESDDQPIAPRESAERVGRAASLTRSMIRRQHAAFTWLQGTKLQLLIILKGTAQRTSALMGVSSSLVCTSLPSVSTMIATEYLRREETPIHGALSALQFARDPLQCNAIFCMQALRCNPLACTHSAICMLEALQLQAAQYCA